MEGLADDEFRLLILLPGNPHEPLRCELRTNTLTKHSPYETLSYVWDNRGNTVKIDVAGHQHAITKGVEAILFRLRQPSEPRTLWIDQLCIDQSNPKEKTAQVQKMRFIYSECTRVLLWMGEIANGIRLEDAEGVFAVIEYMEALGSRNGKSIRTPPKCMASEDLFRAAMRALATISPTRHPWWHRVWTVQEAILPSDAAFVWGPLTLTWATATSASTTWISWTSTNTPGDRESMDLKQMLMATGAGDIGHLLEKVHWTNTSGQGRDGPNPASIKWRDRNSTEVRDNVYALTGLYHARELPRSSGCDYSLSVNRVFINFTLDLIYRVGHGEMAELKPLALDPWQDGVEKIPGLPRWAIDMRHIPEHSPGTWRIFWFYHDYAANKGLPSTGYPEYTGGHLQLSGVVVDVVDVVGDAISPTGCTDGPLDLRGKMMSWWNLYCHDEYQHLLAGFPRTTSTNCSKYEEFCRLILGDTLEDSYERPAKPATIADRQNVSSYLGTGEENDIMRKHVKQQVRNRRFFITKKGLLGLGHLETLPGDEVWVFNHGQVPFTLHPNGTPAAGSASPNSEEYDFVGHCYVQGIMKGLGFEPERGLTGLKQRTVCLH
ncbi:heterokaryon incompatibility protein [Apiospora rasikravindrae]|uniref:Heterokaryon incompatibility protein n=1 Tax=Apiospora rasikravindrae TaxID=990691 RepID=A0ABR1SE00_9PEZI